MSFRHLLMNLKNIKLLKKLWKWANKKQIILIFTLLHLTKKKNEKHLKILSKSQWYDLQFLRYRAKPQKSKFWKWKNLLEISSFYTCAPKITIIWCTVPEIRSNTDKKCCHFGPFFTLLPPPNDCEYQNFEKNEKNAWIYYPFTHTCVP